MKKTKVLFILLVLMLGLSTTMWGDTIHTNDCSAATAGWTFTNSGGVAMQQSGYWLLDFAGTEAIISQAFDVSSYTGLSLTFQVATYGSGTNHSCLVEYSTDNGSSWSATTFTSATPTSSTYISAGTFNIGTISSTQFKLRWTLPAGGSKGVRVDNISFTGTLSAPPTLTTPTSASITSTSATLGATISGTGGSTITASGVVYGTSASPTANPALTSPLVTTATAFTVPVSSLSPETYYYYRGYATNSSGTGYSADGTFRTLSTEPAAHAGSFTNSVVSQGQIDLTFSAASTITNADGYIILRKVGSAPTGTPSDATSYSVGNTIGDGTVAAIITSSSATSSSISGLTAGTAYYFAIIPFNYDGTNNITYNYKTDGSIPTTNGTTQAPNDTDSFVASPAAQADPIIVSSLADTNPEAVNVFKFNMGDNGTDGLVTKVTQVTITAGSTNACDWTTTIEGAKLYIDDLSEYITTGTPVISAGSIVFPISVGDFNLQNENVITVSLYVYLKNTGIVDDAVMAFTIPATSHGFLADATGSTFNSTFGLAIDSNEMLLGVEATKLVFVQQPTTVTTGANISPAVTVRAQDVNGNNDVNYTANVSITATGASLTTSPVTVAAVAGLATFANISFTTAGNGVTLSATSGALSSATSSSFTISLVPAAGEIVINQVCPDYSGASNEYVELLNLTDKTFDLSNLKLEYQSSTGSIGGAGGNLSGTLEPYAYWLLSPDATITVGLTSGLSRDGSITAGFAAANGQIALRLKNSPNTIIDGFAYGSVSPNNLGEGTIFSTAIPTDGGMKRTSDGVDSNVNSADFTTVTNANILLRNHLSYNLGDSPATLPATMTDLTINNTSGNVALPNDVTVSTLNCLNGALDLNGHSLGLQGKDIAVSDAIITGFTSTLDNTSNSYGGGTSIARTWSFRVYGTSDYTISFSYPAGLSGDRVQIWTRSSAGPASWNRIGGIVTTSDVGGVRTAAFTVSSGKNGPKATTYYTIANEDQTLPVELSAFVGTYTTSNGITLSWTTQSENNLLGYNVFKNSVSDLATAERANFSLIAGTNTTQEHVYTYSDKDLEANEYYYWLENIEMDGTSMMHGPVKVIVTSTTPTDPVIPVRTALKAAYPNPFNPSTTVSFDLAKDSQVNITVYNAKGQIVKSLFNGNKNAGQFRLEWNGQDNNGKSCTSGIYFIKMNAGEYSSIKKVMMMK